MSISVLEKYLPPNSLPFLKKWFGEFSIHIKITKNRESKLGDYIKLPDGSHRISINSTLQPELFFFVLTHELAHLISFEKYGRRILPHGYEWKKTYRDMILESLSIYSKELQPIILKYSKSPKANFMATPELVKYFRNDCHNDIIYIEDIEIGSKFLFRGLEFIKIRKRKKNYVCTNLKNGLEYIFSPLVEITRIK